VFASNRRRGPTRTCRSPRGRARRSFLSTGQPGRLREHDGQERDRPSFSWDAQTLYFGRAPGPEGSTDIYITTRDKLPGSTGECCATAPFPLARPGADVPDD
jgi:hypothetical protein